MYFLVVMVLRPRAGWPESNVGMVGLWQGRRPSFTQRTKAFGKQLNLAGAVLMLMTYRAVMGFVIQRQRLCAEKNRGQDRDENARVYPAASQHPIIPEVRLSIYVIV
jgi:hypothetical protein